VLGTSHSYEIVFVRLEAIVIQGPSVPFALYSRFTVDCLLSLSMFHTMIWLDPASHAVPSFGEIRVTTGVEA
jgi:hypothetical protein